VSGDEEQNFLLTLNIEELARETILKDVVALDDFIAQGPLSDRLSSEGFFSDADIKATCSNSFLNKLVEGLKSEDLAHNIEAINVLFALSGKYGGAPIFHIFKDKVSKAAQDLANKLSGEKGSFLVENRKLKLEKYLERNKKIKDYFLKEFPLSKNIFAEKTISKTKISKDKTLFFVSNSSKEGALELLRHLSNRALMEIFFTRSSSNFGEGVTQHMPTELLNSALLMGGNTDFVEVLMKKIFSPRFLAPSVADRLFKMVKFVANSGLPGEAKGSFYKAVQPTVDRMAGSRIYRFLARSQDLAEGEMYDTLARFIQGRGTINKKDPLLKMTPLVIASRRRSLMLLAAFNNKKDALEVLIENDPKQFKALGTSVFNEAAKAGHVDIVKFLYERAAYIESSKNYGPALDLASKKGHLEVVKYLIGKKIDLNTKDARGGTALEAAVKASRLEVALALIAAGADISERVLDLGPVLMSAAACNNLEVVKTIIEKRSYDVNYGFIGGDVFVTDGLGSTRPGVTMLIIAASQGSLEVVKYLVEQPTINLTIAADGGRTALSHAALLGKLEVVKYLVEKFQEKAPKEYPSLLSSALQSAAERGRDDVVEFLIKKCAEIKLPDLSKIASSALDAACRANPSAMSTVDIIISKALAGGFELEWGSETISQILHAKASDNQGEMVVKLLSKGAKDLNQEALVAAADLGYLDIVKSLEKVSKGNLPKALLAAASGGHEKVVEFLVDPAVKANISNPDAAVISAFSPAAERGHAEIVRMLINNVSEETVDFDAQLIKALEDASKNGHAEVVGIVVKEAIRRRRSSNLGVALVNSMSIAMFLNHLATVEKLVSSAVAADGLEIDWNKNVMKNILKYGADNQNENIVRGLISKGVWQHFRIRLAAQIGLLDLVESLMSDLPEAFHNSEIPSALEIAIKAGHVEVTSYLMDKAATLGDKTQTIALVTEALTFAREKGYGEIIDVVISKALSSSFNIWDNPEMLNILHYQADRGQADNVKGLIARGVGRQGGENLKVAAQTGLLEEVQTLIKELTETSTIIKALESAAKEGHAEVISCLIDRVVEIGDCNSEEFKLAVPNMLKHARESDHTAAVDAIVAKALKHDFQIWNDPLMTNVLHYQAGRGKVGDVRSLIAKGVERLSGEGLVVAASKGLSDVVAELVNDNEVNTNDEILMRALNVAVTGDQAGVVAILIDQGFKDKVREHGEKLVASLRSAVANNKDAVAKILIQKGSEYSVLELTLEAIERIGIKLKSSLMSCLEESPSFAPGQPQKAAWCKDVERGSVK
jgi:ankyrin repeat protein